MPTLPTRLQQPSPVNPQVPIPGEFPAIPKEIMDRFPQSAADWQMRLNEFWGRTSQAIQEAQKQTAAQVNSQVIFTVDRFLIYANGVPTPMFALDATGVRLGNVLVVNTPGRKIYIGAGEYANANTPFYVDTLGNFSLGDSFVWDADTDTLTITGIINATSGTIGGFEIGVDYIRDTADTFGLASTVTVGNDVRFWAGGTFANRHVARARIYENGDVVLSTVTFNNAGGAVLNLTSTSTSGQSILFSTSAGSKAFIGLGDAVIGGQSVDDLLFLTPQVGSKFKFYTEANQLRAEITSTGLNSANIGATTPGTGAFTTLSASGDITTLSNSIILANSSNQIPIRIEGQTTSYTALRFTNTGGSSFFGMEGSAAGTIVVGSTAYDTFLRGESGIAFSANNGAGMQMRLSSTGLAVTGALSASGAITATNGVVFIGVGTASVNSYLELNGAATSSYGSFIRFNRNSVVKWQLGHESGIIGNNSDAWLLYDQAAGANALKFTTGVGLAVTGALSVSGLAGIGTRNVVVDAAGNLSAP